MLSLGVLSTQAKPVDRVEMIPIQTASPTTRQFLTGDKGARTAVIAGELRIPRPGPEKSGAVVLVHGSSRIGARQDRWVQEAIGDVRAV